MTVIWMKTLLISNKIIKIHRWYNGIYECLSKLTTVTIGNKTHLVLYRICVKRRALHDTWINYLWFKACISYKRFQNLATTVTRVFNDDDDDDDDDDNDNDGDDDDDDDDNW